MLSMQELAATASEVVRSRCCLRQFNRVWFDSLGSVFPAIFIATVMLFVLQQPAHAYDALSIDSIAASLRGASITKVSTQTQPGDDAVAALADYAKQIDERKSSAGTMPAPRPGDEAYAALREFARKINADESAATGKLQRVAQGGKEADSLFEFLQQRLNSPSSSEPARPTRPPARSEPAVPSAPINATYVGEKTCLNCHSSHAAEFAKTLMGRIGKSQPGKFACENCHGPGSAHAKAGGGRGVGGIISFRSNDTSRTVSENNAICLACHERGNRNYWRGSTHEVRDVACTDCHTVMKNVSRKAQLKTEYQPDTCAQCHKDRRAQIYRSGHMPLKEGKVVCSDCHNPHGSVTTALLKEVSINDTCYKCHAEKRGPYLFEHLPVRENCANCHEPHGSVNEFSLRVSRPRLCQECHNINHAEAAGPLSLATQSRACNNCHTQVHGSNSPAGAAFQR